jgi:hypothetical protein
MLVGKKLEEVRVVVSGLLPAENHNCRVEDKADTARRVAMVVVMMMMMMMFANSKNDMNRKTLARLMRTAMWIM